MLEQAAAARRKRGDSIGLARCMSHLGTVALLVGDYRRASSCLNSLSQLRRKRAKIIMLPGIAINAVRSLLQG
jgi:hypothetical protein